MNVRQLVRYLLQPTLSKEDSVNSRIFLSSAREGDTGGVGRAEGDFDRG